MKTKRSFAVKLLNFLLNLVLSVAAVGSVMVMLAVLNPPYAPEIGRLIFAAYCLAITLPYVLILLSFVALPVLCIVYLIVRYIRRKAK